MIAKVSGGAGERIKFLKIITSKKIGKKKSSNMNNFEAFFFVLV